jgi:hypothetical protein
VQVLKQALLRAKRKQRTHQVIQLARREPGKNIGFSDIYFSRQNDKQHMVFTIRLGTIIELHVILLTMAPKVKTLRTTLSWRISS